MKVSYLGIGTGLLSILGLAHAQTSGIWLDWNHSVVRPGNTYKLGWEIKRDYVRRCRGLQGLIAHTSLPTDPQAPSSETIRWWLDLRADTVPRPRRDAPWRCIYLDCSH